MIWGTAFVAQSVGMEYMGPFTFNGIRYFPGAAVLLPFVLMNRKNPGEKRTGPAGEGKLFSRRALAGGFLCGVFLCVASNLQQYAMISADVGKAGFLTAMYIVIVPVLSFFITKKTTLRLWISVALACAGLYFLSISGSMRLEREDLALIACAFVFSLHIMCISRFPDVDGVVLSFIQFIVAGALSLSAALLTEDISFSAVKSGWFPLLYAGVFSCGIAYTFQIIGQKGVDPAIASLILSLESVVSVLAGFLILGQALSVRELAGCALMFLAIILVQLPEKILNTGQLPAKAGHFHDLSGRRSGVGIRSGEKVVMKLNRTTGYLVVICLFLFAVNSFLGFILTKQSDAAMRTLIENRMLDISNTAAAMLDGDSLEVIEAQDKETPQYQSVLKTLSYFQENIDLEYIYCIRDLGSGNFVFTIDPSEDPGEFGEPVVYTDALYRASLGEPSVDKEPYGDRWGRFYSAYTPVFNSDHRITGIVAVDFSAEWYEKQIKKQFWTTIVVSGISLFIACVIIFLSAANFDRKFQKMLNEMNEISGGIETLVNEVAPGSDSGMPGDDITQSAGSPDINREDPSAKGGSKASRDGFTELGNRIRSLEEQLGRRISFVRSQAFVDGLTGLGNRAAYEDHVLRLNEAIKKKEARFSIAVFDLNGLKELNDRYGHEKGDQAIRQAALVLKKVYEDGKVYRIGGDEFIVVIEDPDYDVSLRYQEIDRLLGEMGEVSLAKGAAEFDPVYDVGYRVVFNRADYAMYNDKREYYLTHADRRRRG